MKKMSEPQFIAAVCAHLESSIVQLAPSQMQRLDDMRQQAIATVSASQAAESDEDLLQTTRAALDLDAKLDPEIEARLDQIRQQAMAKLQKHSATEQVSILARAKQRLDSFLGAMRIPMAGSLVAATCVMLTIALVAYISSRPSGTLSFEEEISLIASADDIELYENLEFYLWLAESGIPN